MATYTNSDQVKLILKTNRTNRIKFREISTYNLIVNTNKNPLGSGNVGFTVDPKAAINYNLIFRVKDVQISPSFDGYRRIMLFFDDSSNYRVFESEERNGRWNLVGSSDILTEYESPDLMYRIPTSCFGGTISPNDSVQFDIECHISDQDIDIFINLAEVEIDTFLQGGGHKFEDGFQTRVFGIGQVPSTVNSATAYLAAYLIYTSIFADEQRDFEGSKDIRSMHFTERWKKKVDSDLKAYLKVANRRMPQSYIKFSAVSDKARCLFEAKFIDKDVRLAADCKDC